jgi:hypothetical protein
MIRVITLLVVVILTVTPSAGLSVEASYDCVRTGHTNIGWSGRKSAYTAEALPKVTKPSIVKLSELNTDRPFLMGQGVTRLQRLSDDGATTWFVEQAPAGTIILWTFFAMRKDLELHRSLRLQAEFANRQQIDSDGVKQPARAARRQCGSASLRFVAAGRSAGTVDGDGA